MSLILQENYTAGEFLIRESGNYRSRATILFDNTGGTSDLTVPAGSVYSIQQFGTATVTAGAGNHGNGVLSGVSANPEPTEIGTYSIKFINATSFAVTAPDGSILAPGVVVTPYLDGIGFEVTAGGTSFLLGDGYTITVAIGQTPVVAPNAGNIGNGTCGAVKTSFADAAMIGNYQLTFVSPTAFSVLAPDGRALAGGNVGVPYEDEICFIVSAGATAFAIGDIFIVPPHRAEPARASWYHFTLTPENWRQC